MRQPSGVRRTDARTSSAGVPDSCAFFSRLSSACSICATSKRPMPSSGCTSGTNSTWVRSCEKKRDHSTGVLRGAGSLAKRA